MIVPQIVSCDGYLTHKTLAPDISLWVALQQTRTYLNSEDFGFSTKVAKLRYGNNYITIYGTFSDEKLLELERLAKIEDLLYCAYDQGMSDSRLAGDDDFRRTKFVRNLLTLVN